VTAPALWTESFSVRAYEIGPDERARVLTLCDYAQEAAGNHARALGVESFDLGHGPGAWVLHRLRMRVDRFPDWREAVGVETWPSAEDGLRAERDFVFRGEGGVPLAHAVSTWLVLDVARRRPARLPASVRAIRVPVAPRALPPAAPPTAPEEAAAECRFSVRRADLDRNGHANNVRFVEWALEGVTEDVAASKRLAAFDALFKAEAAAGDTVVVETASCGADSYAHRLRRAADGIELAVLHTHWAAP